MRLVAVEFMTLDGVMEAPGFEEHRSGRNAWAMRVADSELQGFNGDQVKRAGALLFGRTTFNIWAAYWPTAPKPAAPMAARIAAIPKYVYSRTLAATDWANTTILGGDLETEVRRLKAQQGGDLLLYGSADLLAGLLELDLVDEMELLLFPVILGSGKRLFRDEADLRYMELLNTRTTSSGVVILTYRRAAAEPPLAPDAAAAYVWTDDQRQSLRATETDRVLATVLFTDIVDSTAKAAELGDRAWADLVRRHHALVRGQLDRFRGRELDTAGDGFFAAFDGPVRAIRCASAIGEGVRDLGLEVRAGLHTGECEVVGEKLAGMAVNIGARIASQAHSGEVLVSSTVTELVAGSGLAFVDRGVHALKGVPGEWRLFALAS
jgi:class 3 adenylate cyclase/dihydrofolate reductase